MTGSEVSILPASSIDRRLISLAAKYATPEEMSEGVLGKLTPAQCIERVQTLLSSKSIFDEVQERRLLLVQMAEHLDWMKSQRENPKSWNSIPRMYKILSDQIERANINVSDISTKLAEDHARYFAEGFSRGFEAIIKMLAERNDIVVDEGEMLELMEAGAEESQEYIERVTAKNAD